MRLSNLKPLVLVGVAALATVGAALVFRGAERRFLDARLTLRQDHGWPKDLVMVAIDDGTLQEYGRWPWPRGQTGQLVEAVRDLGAKTILLDVFFGNASDPASDNALAASLAKAHPVLGVGCSNMPLENAIPESIRNALVPGSAPPILPQNMVVPLPAFARAAGHLGLSCAVPGSDGENRAHAPFRSVVGADGALPSSSLEAFLLQRGFTQKDVHADYDRLDLPTGTHLSMEGGQFFLDFAPSGSTPLTLSARDILHARDPARANPAAVATVRAGLAGKLALVYLDNEYTSDLFNTPVGSKVPGARLMAYAIRTLDNGRTPRLIPLQIPLAVVLLLSLLSAVPLARRSPGMILGTGLGAVLSYLLLAGVLVRTSDLFLPAISPCFLLLASSGMLAAWAGRVGEIERVQMRRLLESVRQSAASEDAHTVEKQPALELEDEDRTRPGARVMPVDQTFPRTDPNRGRPVQTGSRPVEIGVGTETRRGSGATGTKSGAELLVGGTVLEEPVQIGQYEVQRSLGRGGMGAIFLAIDRDLDRPVAIKILESANKDTYVRFRREALAVARISHPNVVQVYEVGLDSSVPFIVMEYVAGGTLSDLLRDPDVPSPMPWERSTRIISGVAKGLGAAHVRGIVHRDIKPANILLVSRKTEFPKLADFGIAKLSGADQLTREGLVVGTVGYLSPEQATGKPVSARSDVYSLAVMFYRLLTGMRAFDGTTEEMLVKSMTRGLPDPRNVNPSIPSGIAELVVRMGSLDPETRPKDGNVVAAALDLFLNH